MPPRNSRALEDASAPAEPPAARDPWFNVHLYPGSQRAWDVFTEIWKQFCSYPKRKRAMKSKDLATTGPVCVAVVCNLIYHHLGGGLGEGVPVPRSKKELGGRPTRYEPFVFPWSFPKMLDTLCDLGFVQQAIGVYSAVPSRSKRTTIRAGTKLIELIDQHKITFADIKVGEGDEIIILKRPKRGRSDEGERVDYVDDARTHRYRKELRDINAWIAQADISFDPAAYHQLVDVQARRLRRIFTLGKFDSGGRLFGGFWEMLPKDVRLRGIIIEGEAVIGLDYSQLNPVLAYYLAEAVPPAEDAYTLPGLENHRDGVKKVFNAMLFHTVKKFPQGAKALFPRRVKCGDVTAAILEQHPKLKGVLSRVGVGHELQYRESEIMMSVLRRCRSRNIIALPVFDCAVVKTSEADTVEKIMRREFKAVTGLDIAVKREAALAVAVTSEASVFRGPQWL